MKDKILNWLGDVMFDLTDFCESVALKCKEASGHGLKKKLAEAEEKDFSECMNVPEVNEEDLFAIKSKKTGKYVSGVDKNGKKKLTIEPELIGSDEETQDYWYEFGCKRNYYSIVRVKKEN